MSSKPKQDDFSFRFKEEITYGKYLQSKLMCLIEKRVQESKKILEKFAERVPVIIQKAQTEETLPELEQEKYSLFHLINTCIGI